MFKLKLITDCSCQSCGNKTKVFEIEIGKNVVIALCNNCINELNKTVKQNSNQEGE